jgi:ABC-type multidrug transport system ATPase subunit
MIDMTKNVCQRAHNPVKLTWSNIDQNVEVESRDASEGHPKGTKYKKQIINDATGYAMPGQALFIMGASGSGKTSLLNILAERFQDQAGLEVKGDIIVNDTLKFDDDNFGKLAAYVMQDDILFEYFTPKEALTFAADLKLAHLSQEERTTRVEQIID